MTTPEDPEINQPTIDYVAAFVPEATGKQFNPHVTIGIASQDYLKAMLAEPFEFSRSRRPGRPCINSATWDGSDGTQDVGFEAMSSTIS